MFCRLRWDGQMDSPASARSTTMHRKWASGAGQLNMLFLFLGVLQMIKLYLPWLSLFDQSLCFSFNFWSLTNFSSGSDLCMVSMLFAIGDYNDQGPVLWADHLVIFIGMLACILCWVRNQCISLFCLFGHLRPQIN